MNGGEISSFQTDPLPAFPSPEIFSPLNSAKTKDEKFVQLFAVIIKIFCNGRTTSILSSKQNAGGVQRKREFLLAFRKWSIAFGSSKENQEICKLLIAFWRKISLIKITIPRIRKNCQVKRTLVQVLQKPYEYVLNEVLRDPLR